jgi:hypothetical protein
MIDRTVVVTMAGALALMLTVLELVRRRRLKEEYSLLWLATAVVVLVLASSRALLDAMARAMGIFYPPSALVVAGFGLLLVAALHFSVVVSRLAEENKTLAQELAILRWQMRTVERWLAADPSRRLVESDSGHAAD